MYYIFYISFYQYGRLKIVLFFSVYSPVYKMNYRKKENHKGVYDGKQNGTLYSAQVYRKTNRTAQNRLDGNKRDHRLFCSKTDIEQFVV